MKIINLPCYELRIELSGGTEEDEGRHVGGQVFAGQLEDEPAFSGVLRMLLAHAVAGIDVESPAYLEGLETAVEGITDEL